jgi:hypothetical protein
MLELGVALHRNKASGHANNVRAMMELYSHGVGYTYPGTDTPFEICPETGTNLLVELLEEIYECATDDLAHRTDSRFVDHPVYAPFFVAKAAAISVKVLRRGIAIDHERILGVLIAYLNYCSSRWTSASASGNLGALVIADV